MSNSIGILIFVPDKFKVVNLSIPVNLQEVNKVLVQLDKFMEVTLPQDSTINLFNAGLLEATIDVRDLQSLMLILLKFGKLEILIAVNEEALLIVMLPSLLHPVKSNEDKNGWSMILMVSISEFVTFKLLKQAEGRASDLTPALDISTFLSLLKSVTTTL